MLFLGFEVPPMSHLHLSSLATPASHNPYLVDACDPIRAEFELRGLAVLPKTVSNNSLPSAIALHQYCLSRDKLRETARLCQAPSHSPNSGSRAPYQLNLG